MIPSTPHLEDFAILKGLHVRVVGDPARRSFTRSSAGVFSGAKLIRTLWSERPMVDRVIDASLWDGLDDNGAIAPSGNYTIKVLDASRVNHEWYGAIGNTSPNPPHARWRPMDAVHGMAITPAGKIYVATGYDEARCSTYYTSVDNPQVPTEVLPATYRYTGPVSLHVATDGARAYFAGGGGNSVARRTSAVWAVNVRDDSLHTFQHGASYQAFIGGQIVSSAISKIDGPDNWPTGIAVQPSGDLLFVSRSALNAIHVYDKTTGALITTITSLTAPTRMRCDAAGDVWIAHTLDRAPVVAKYTINREAGALMLARGSQIKGLSQPLALAITPDGKTIRIADGGKSQQIKSYSTSNAVLQSTYGRASGYALGPDVTNDKLWFHNGNPITLGSPSPGVYGAPMAVLEHQPDGKLWVGDPGNLRTMRFNVTGANYTFVDEITWVGANYACAIDMNDPSRVFSAWHEYLIDFNKTPGQPGWWKLVRNWGFGVPAQRNSGQLRMYRAVTLSNGRRYFQNRSPSGTEIAELDRNVVRFTGVTGGLETTGLRSDGTLSVYSTPRIGEPIVFKQRALIRFDALNNPVYGPENVIVSSPRTMSADTRPQSVVVDLSPWEVTPNGVIPVWDPKYQSRGWHLSGVDARSGEWRWRAMPSTPRNLFRTPALAYWPGDAYFNTSVSSNAGGNLYQTGPHILAGYFGEGVAQAQANKWYHFHDSGLLVSNFGEALDGDGSTQIGIAGNALRGGVAMRDGALYLAHNDESYGSCVHMWRVTGLETLAFHEHKFSWDARKYVRPAADPRNLLEGLPYDSPLVSGTAGWTRSPATDTLTSFGSGPFWQVETNQQNYSKWDDRDLTARFNLEGAAHVQKTLPEGVGPRWTFTCLMQSLQGDGGSNLTRLSGHAYLEIVDAADRVIARWHAHEYTPSKLFGVYGNRTAIQTFANTKEVHAVIRQALILKVRSSGAGKIAFQYGPYPEIETVPLDERAEWSKPARLRLSFLRGPGGAYPRQISIRRARME